MSKDKGKKGGDAENSKHDMRKIHGETMLEKHMKNKGKAKAKPKMKTK